MILSKFCPSIRKLAESRVHHQVSKLIANSQTLITDCPSNCTLQVCQTFTNPRDFVAQRMTMESAKLRRLRHTYDRWYFLEDYFWGKATQFLEDVLTFRHLLFSFRDMCDGTHGSNEQSNNHIRTHKHAESQREIAEENARVTNSEGDMVNGDQKLNPPLFCKCLQNQKPIPICAVAGRTALQ